ncbi:xylanase/chitin deacetylase [Penicillium atrosanguineum]|nr:xylanase/chitin deacetylase [Penicillium atrosanguineum]
MLFLASSHTSGNILGQYIQPDSDSKSLVATKESETTQIMGSAESIPRMLANPKRNKIRVIVSIDLDAMSGWLGTKLTRLLQILTPTTTWPTTPLASLRPAWVSPDCFACCRNSTWPTDAQDLFQATPSKISPTRSSRSSPQGLRSIFTGYAHEGAYQLTPEQERDM